MADNPFSVTPANPLQALMIGQQSFDRSRGIAKEDAMMEGRKKAVQAMAAGADPKQVYGFLMEAGDMQAATGIASMTHQQAQEKLAQAQFAESSRHNRASEGIQRDNLARRDVPAGFTRTDGGLAPIKGGPADPDYKRTVTDRQNAPAGYKWKDPNNPDAGLMPIPGGPGEKMDAEVAGRIGLAKSFLGQLDDYTDAEGKQQTGLRKRLKAGETSGPVDGPMAWAGFGGQGEARRILDSGAEALLRNLTGAGMNKDEAAQYVRRYQFSLRDTPAAAVSKLNQLERELRSVIETVGRGRGGAGEVAPPMGGAPTNVPKQQGVVDYRTYFGGQ